MQRPLFSVVCPGCKRDTPVVRVRDDTAHFVFECLACGKSGDRWLRPDVVGVFDSLIAMKMESMREEG